MIRSSVLALLLASAAPAAAAAQEAVNPFPFLNEQPTAPAADADPAEALAGALRILGDNPNDLRALETAGRAALECGDPSSSIGFWARADKLEPGNGRVKAGLAAALVQAEQPRRALQLFDQAVAAGIPEAQIAGDRGLANDLLGNNRKAQADYRIALRARADAEVTRRLALSLAMTGDRVGALATLDPLLRRQDMGAWRARAFVLALTGDVAGADADARSVLQPAQAAQIAPFLARLATLPHAEQAAAVNFGDMPAGGRPATTLELASARPTAPAASTMPATSLRAVPQGTLAPSVRSLPQSLPPVRVAQATGPTDFAGRPIGVTAAGVPSSVQPARVAPAPVSRVLPPAERGPIVASGPVTRPPQPVAPVLTRASGPIPAAPAGSAPASAPAASTAILAANTQLQPGSATQPAAPPALRLPLVPQATVIAADSGPTLPAPSAAPAAAQPSPSPAVPPAPAPAALARAEEPRPAPVVAPPPARESTPVVHVEHETRAAARPASAAPERYAANSLGAQAVALGARGDFTPTGRLPLPPRRTTPVESTDALSASSGRARPVQLASAGDAGTRSKAGRRTASAADEDAPRSGGAGRGHGSDAADDRDATRGRAAKTTREARAKPAPAAAPRVWVQVAGGANKHDLGKAWEKLRKASPDLYAGRTPSTTPLRFTNRLLVGPFKSEDEAQDYVNKLTKGGQSGFIVKTDAGQKVEKVSAGD